MKPSYERNQKIKDLEASIILKIKTLKKHNFSAPEIQLRKQQNTNIAEGQTEIKTLTELKNASLLYKNINEYRASSSKSLLIAHKDLMQGLVQKAGIYRSKRAGIVKNKKIELLFPSPKEINFLINKLFNYLKDTHDSTLIKSCVFHYHLAYIHPFIDGNGRIARFWQTLILIQEYAIFEFISIENLIVNNHREYYMALCESDKTKKSTVFIEYMLTLIENSLRNLNK